jgi:hypothetical protein
MATNKNLEEGKKLLKDQVEEVGFLDNAFKTLAATITSAIDDAIDSMEGLDDVTKKVAKSYQQDITASIKKSTRTLEDQIAIQEKINAGKNVGKEIEDKLSINSARRQLTLKKIEQLEGISNKQKRQMLETANDVFKAEEEALKTLKKNNEERQKGKSFFEIAKENAGSLADKIDKSGTLSKVLSGGIKSVLTPMRLLELAVVGVFDAMVKIDKLNGDLAKGLNLSYNEAAALTSELTHAANKSGELKLTGEGLGKALLAVNEITGVYTTENSKNLETLQLIHKASGLTYEQMGGIYSVTQATGGDLKKNTKEVLAQSTLTAQSYGVQINSKKVLADIGKISKATTLSLGGSAAELSKALTTSQALGMEMSTIENISESLLNFESSIEKELEAELLLGKNINLEKARQAALNNDIATVAEEIAKQAGSAADFAKMNRIQQQALAEAVGLSREDLANSLFIQEQLANSVGKEYEEKKKIIDELQAKGLSQDQIKEKLGKESLADLKAQSSVQENLNKSVAKLKEGFASIAAPLMQIINPIVDLLIPAVEMLSYLFVPITTALVGMTKLLSGNVGELTVMQGILGGIATIYLSILGYKKLIALRTAGMAALETAISFQLALQNQAELKGIALGKSKLVQLAAQAALFALANPIKALLGLGVAAAVGAVAYNLVSKGDDIMSPGSNSSGYGSRTLFGPEGAIALNNKDTVIAGTNLFSKGDDVVSSPAGAIQMPNNSESKRTNALLEALINKPAPKVQMDSIEVGTVAGMSAFSIQ